MSHVRDGIICISGQVIPPQQKNPGFGRIPCFLLSLLLVSSLLIFLTSDMPPIYLTCSSRTLLFKNQNLEVLLVLFNKPTVKSDPATSVLFKTML